jgi:hypothetical protein
VLHNPLISTRAALSFELQWTRSFPPRTPSVHGNHDPVRGWVAVDQWRMRSTRTHVPEQLKKISDRGSSATLTFMTWVMVVVVQRWTCDVAVGPRWIGVFRHC